MATGTGAELQRERLLRALGIDDYTLTGADITQLIDQLVPVLMSATGQFVDPDLELRFQEGRSAYQVWLELGNVGTVEDFFNSLVGPKGDQGVSEGLKLMWREQLLWVVCLMSPD